jgi:choline dehydrogenase-like flavoprotein
MGRDPRSVVDGQLRVYGLEGLRIADASIFPRIPTANTMAPCVVVGERVSDLLKATHGHSVAARANLSASIPISLEDDSHERHDQ